MSSDSGLFGPASVTWRVHGDPAYPVATLSGLLLQALHPRAMAVVAQGGGFKADAWGRLNRTGEYLATITYGEETVARRAAARVRGIHRRVYATDPVNGERIRADEPDLLRWVHCSELITVLRVARIGGVGLTGAEEDRYIREQVVAAELVGLAADAVPHDTRDLRAYQREVRPALGLTEAAREGAWAFANPPMAGWVRALTPARPAWHGLAALSFGLLPSWARRMYRLPGLAVTDIAATAGLRALRRTVLVLPEGWRQSPAVRAARAAA